MVKEGKGAGREKMKKTKTKKGADDWGRWLRESILAGSGDSRNEGRTNKNRKKTRCPARQKGSVANRKGKQKEDRKEKKKK